MLLEEFWSKLFIRYLIFAGLCLVKVGAFTLLPAWSEHCFSPHHLWVLFSAVLHEEKGRMETGWGGREEECLQGEQWDGRSVSEH